MLAAHLTAANAAALTRTLLKTTWHLVPRSSPPLLATGNKKKMVCQELQPLIFNAGKAPCHQSIHNYLRREKTAQS